MSILSAKRIWEVNDDGVQVETTYVEVTQDNEPLLYTMEYPAQDAGTYHHRELDQWIADGGVISNIAPPLPAPTPPDPGLYYDPDVGQLMAVGLPTSDPGIEGAVWIRVRPNRAYLMVSKGAV